MSACPTETTGRLAMAAPDRRALLGGVAATLTAAVTTRAAARDGDRTAKAPNALAKPEDPDADLIALCRQFDDLERRICTILNAAYGADEDEDADCLTAPLHAAQDPLFERITTTPAMTLAGLQAKAASFVLWHSPGLVPESDGWGDRLQTSLLADLLGAEIDAPDAGAAVHDAMMAGTFEIGSADRTQSWKVSRARYV